MLLSPDLFAINNNKTTNHTKENVKKEKFNPGEMIFGHILDSYEWHIATIGKMHISVPTIIILYYNNKLDVFLSGKFHHGHKSYKGYKIEQQGKNKGKIVRVIDDGITTDKSASLPIDLSITKNVMSIFISFILLCFIFISVAKSYTKNKKKSPKGLQSLLEPVILFVRDDIAKTCIGKKKYERYMPFLLTVFFFILLNNLLGIIPIFPGGANVTGNISVTLVLAVFTLIITSVTGNKRYWKDIFNSSSVPWWLKIPMPLVPIIEIMGMFTKPFALMMRLFANMLSGHIIILSIIGLIFIFGEFNIGLGYGVSVISVLFVVFMDFLELLVAFIQAYVFTLLSAVYFGMATEED